MIAELRHGVAICPECGHEQEEPPEAVSSFCRACGFHMTFKGYSVKKTTSLPKPRRDAKCPQCGEEHRVAESALCTICPSCSYRMNLQNYRISGGRGTRLETLGTVEFVPGSSYEGMEVVANRVMIGGAVRARIIAREEIDIMASARFGGRLDAPLIRVLSNAKASVERVMTPQFEVRGRIRLNAVRAAQIRVFDGGCLMADKILAGRLEVNLGGILAGHLRVEPDAWPLYGVPTSEDEKS